MDAIQISGIVGVGAQIMATVLQSYTTFKKSNVEKYFERLLNEGKDLRIYGKREDLQRYLFKIIDEVSSEANVEKIEQWKNATIHLATDYADFDLKDNFIRALEDLTVFDLSVLFKIYSTDFPKEHFEAEIIAFFEDRGIKRDMIMHTLKRLSVHYLISEMTDSSTYLSDGNEPSLGENYFVKTELGKEFLRFIESEFYGQK